MTSGPEKVNKRSPTSIKLRKEKAAKLRATRMAEGLCITCGDPSVKGKKRCSVHLKYSNDIAKAYAKSEKGRATRKKHRLGIGRYIHVSRLAKQQGKAWLLSEETWRSIISMPCAYCGLENNSGGGAGMDRLNNSKGYIPGNVVSCCKECNTARHDNFSPEEMRAIGMAIRQVKLARK